ncbi:MltR family transcriptional regulator [Pararhizobium sp.]|uniref:MltR family transcriptional regulator n=1 Tax=Pararhizobium sp. TaxID=1977563 RepID=UPI003D119FA9
MDQDLVADKADVIFGNLNRLQQIIQDLDDRGLILALAAFAEEALGDLIGAYLVEGEPSRQLTSGFNAPLGTFSARSKMAFALGLVTKGQYQDLERLRRIRNEFAHKWEPLSFADPKIAAHISALHFSGLNMKFPDSPAEKVRSVLSVLLMELRATTIRSSGAGRLKLLGTRLVAGVAGDFDEQISACKKHLTEIAEELVSASDQRRRFLQAVRRNWVGYLEIVRLNAPPGRRHEVLNLRAELNAWNDALDERDA